MTKEQIKEFTFRTSQANHSGLILVLTDIVNTYITDSKDCYERSCTDEYMSNLELALRATNELISCFAPDNLQGREVISLLRFIYGRLVTSGVRRRPCDLDTCISMLAKLRVAFERLHELDDEGPVMKNTHQVYAGLTYGKGVLNESVDSMDAAKRGFYI